MKKKHDTVCIAIFLLAQKNVQFYWIVLQYNVMFSKLLYSNEEVC